MNNTIDFTKKYKTRDGRAVTGLRPATEKDGFDSEWKLVGRIIDSEEEYTAAWTDEGRDHLTGLDSSDDLVLAEDQELEFRSPLVTLDPLKVEYGTFVASVKANFAAGTFATATQEQFDAWLQSLTPILRA